MNQDQSRQSLLVYLIGFAVAAGCAAWAGSRFAENGSNLGFGVLTGLSVGAVFAFGQRIRQYFFPTAASTTWKIHTGPGTSDPRQARRAAARAKPMTVTFNEEVIDTVRNGAVRESIAWRDITRITITIGDDFLPMPYWMIATGNGGIRLPNDTAGLEELTEAFKTNLPGYESDASYEAVIAAMGATEGSFAVWKKGTAL